MVFYSSSTQLVTLRSLGRLDIVASCRLRMLLDAQSRVDVRELTHAIVRRLEYGLWCCNGYEGKVRVWSPSLHPPPLPPSFSLDQTHIPVEYPQD